MGAKMNDHWQKFVEFSTLEMQAGGPDPHMKVAGHMSRNEPLPERIWRAGCYVGVYNVPSAEVLWRHWPWPRIVEEPEALLPWLQEHWKGLSLRRERRCVRTPAKLNTFLTAYGQWAHSAKLPDDPSDLAGNYERLWDEARSQVKFLGRYGGFKLLEFLRRYCEVPAALPDIRPAGGWSPRETLAMLVPEHRELLVNGGDGRKAQAAINEIASDVRQRLANEWLLPLDWFIFEVLLCDYRQTYYRQYPGKSQDSELDYYAAIEPYWGPDWLSIMWGSRAALFPKHHLGEHAGWGGTRKELVEAFTKHGYYWTDSKYDYLATTDLAHPVVRS